MWATSGYPAYAAEINTAATTPATLAVVKARTSTADLVASGDTVTFTIEVTNLSDMTLATVSCTINIWMAVCI
ncbi:MAG: hypothetical protein H6645_07290 [Caldilineaceae bacterium]|nr:hypothetical protein [Caldilineaceae bacterium]